MPDLTARIAENVTQIRQRVADAVMVGRLDFLANTVGALPSPNDELLPVHLDANGIVAIVPIAGDAIDGLESRAGMA